jgi:sialate O-acetylesterase
MKIRSATYLLLILALCTGSVSAEVTLPKVFGSRMVMQRDIPLTVWGWAKPGEKVTAKMAGNSASATADDKGNWRVKLPAMKAGGPHTMTVTGSNTVTFTDILIGEVWISSGQSNMAFTMRKVLNARKELAKCSLPKIRLLRVPLVERAKPATDVKASWQVCTPKSAWSFSAVLFCFGRDLHRELGVPVGLIAAPAGGGRIEPWIVPQGLTALPAESKMRGRIAKSRGFSRRFNGTIYPLAPYAIRGAIWYQGEGNYGDGMAYYPKMKALIGGWRSVWGQGDFPFYFVQLAAFKPKYPLRWAKTREGQAATLSVPNTGMAVAMDCGNLKNIHPRNKQEVGRRLALWALAKTYGKKDLVYAGPMYKSMSVEGSKVRIRYDHVGGGLAARDGKPLSWFEIAGADQKFVEAQAVIDGETVIVSAPAVTKPVAVRFAFRGDALPNLVNKEGLPAAQFRTDAW